MKPQYRAGTLLKHTDRNWYILILGWEFSNRRVFYKVMDLKSGKPDDALVELLDNEKVWKAVAYAE